MNNSKRKNSPVWLLFPALIIMQLLINTHALHGGTTIELNPKIADFTDQADMISKVQDKSDLNGPFLADAFALSNITGYPNGSATIGSFPHFQAGVAIGSGCTNMEYFDEESEASDNGSFPMIIPNPVLHVGFGIIGGLDFIGKIFIFDSSMYRPDYENDIATIKDFSLYSAGGRVRYNILPRFTIVPALLSFGGITISMGADAMIGRFRVEGEYETAFEDITVDYSGTDYPLGEVLFEGDYIAEVNWKIISGTVTALAYMELFSIFTVYTGVGITLGVGSFKTDFQGVGLCTTDNNTYFLAAGTYEVGTLTFTSKNKYTAHPFIPTYILGAEVSLFFFKLHVETMVNLYTGKDVTALIGARIQF